MIKNEKEIEMGISYFFTDKVVQSWNKNTGDCWFDSLALTFFVPLSSSLDLKLQIAVVEKKNAYHHFRSLTQHRKWCHHRQWMTFYHRSFFPQSSFQRDHSKMIRINMMYLRLSSVRKKRPSSEQFSSFIDRNLLASMCSNHRVCMFNCILSYHIISVIINNALDKLIIQEWHWIMLITQDMKTSWTKYLETMKIFLSMFFIGKFDNCDGRV